MRTKIGIIVLGLTRWMCDYTTAWTYPTPVIAKPACRFQHRDVLGDDCKMPLPRITNADYALFQNSILHRSVYSVLRGASYTYRRDLGGGGHPGVDIATAKGTPVVAIGDGVVVDASWKGDRGNTVIIKHTIGREVVYSTYNHLDSIETVAGAEVSEGLLIGRVGDSGNAFGNHLHFQIDRDTRINHPFFYPGCKGSIASIVNLGMCRDQLPIHTLDPIVFLESQGAKMSYVDTVIDPAQFMSPEEVQKHIISQFLDRYPIVIQTDMVDDVLSIDDIATMNISIAGYDGVLPESLTIRVGSGDDNGSLDLSISEISYLNRQRSILINPLQPGLVTLTIALGEREIAKKYIAITTKSTLPKPVRATIRWVPVRYGYLAVIRLRDDQGLPVTRRNGSVAVSVSGFSSSLCPKPLSTVSSIRRALRASCDGSQDIPIEVRYQQSLSGLILIQTKKNIGPQELLIRRNDGVLLSN